MSRRCPFEAARTRYLQQRIISNSCLLSSFINVARLLLFVVVTHRLVHRKKQHGYSESISAMAIVIGRPFPKGVSGNS
jgi:hypothetical protein